VTVILDVLSVHLNLEKLEKIYPPYVLECLELGYLWEENRLVSKHMYIQ
jgi:hypothetical protein